MATVPSIVPEVAGRMTHVLAYTKRWTYTHTTHSRGLPNYSATASTDPTTGACSEVGLESSPNDSLGQGHDAVHHATDTEQRRVGGGHGSDGDKDVVDGSRGGRGGKSSEDRFSAGAVRGSGGSEGDMPPCSIDVLTSLDRTDFMLDYQVRVEFELSLTLYIASGVDFKILFRTVTTTLKLKLNLTLILTSMPSGAPVCETILVG